MDKEEDMPRVRFSAKFVYTPKNKPSMSISYKQGYEGMVPRGAADAAIAKGVAVLVTPAEPSPAEDAETPATGDDDAASR